MEQEQELSEGLKLTESLMDGYEISSRKMGTKRKQEAPKRKAKKRKLDPWWAVVKDLRIPGK